jgi:hypothetical protein
MLYHLTCKIVGRAKGMDATAAAAYITRTEVEDRTTGLKFDHTHHKDKAILTQRYLPESHPEWAEVHTQKKGKRVFLDFGEFWNLVEERETRKDSQFARNFNLAAQEEFTDKENLECFEKWIIVNFTSRGIVVDGAYHEAHIEEDGSNNSNKHFHALAAIRQINKDGWFEKKDREANTKEFLDNLRKSWADINNEMFEKKFCKKHSAEMEEIVQELQDLIPDNEARSKEALELLYDRYQEEWNYMSEKTLDAQRQEVEERLEAEEDKETLNIERITRLEKKFLSIPFEAQKHLGVAKNKKRRKEKTDRDLYISGEKDPKKKNKELQKALDNVSISDEELEKALLEDPDYMSLTAQKERLLKQAEENIYDDIEVKMIKDQVDSIKTVEEMAEWRKTVWKPIENRIRKTAERNAAYDDLMGEKSEIQEVFNQAPLDEMSLVQQIAVKERQQSLLIFIEAEKEKSFIDSKYQVQELDDTLAEMTLLKKIANKFKEVLEKIKEKASEIIEKSPLRKFKIFRAQKKIVDDWTPYQITEELTNGQQSSIGGEIGSDSRTSGNNAEATNKLIDFQSGIEQYSDTVDTERHERAVQEAARRKREAAEREQKRNQKSNINSRNSDNEHYNGR